MITNVKNIVPWTYFTNDLNGEKIVGTVYKKKLQRKKKRKEKKGKSKDI